MCCLWRPALQLFEVLKDWVVPWKAVTGDERPIWSRISEGMCGLLFCSRSGNVSMLAARRAMAPLASRSFSTRVFAAAATAETPQTADGTPAVECNTSTLA